MLLLLLSGCNKSHMRQARALEHQGRYAEALRDYQQSLEVTTGRHDRAQLHARIAACLLQLQHMQDAYSELQLALRDDPEETEAQIETAELLAASGRQQESRQMIESVLRREPANEDALVALYDSYLVTGEYSVAESLLKNALIRKPDATNVAIRYADLLLEHDRADDARRVLASSALASGRTQPEGAANAWLADARLEEQAGDPNAAEKAYLRAKLAFHSQRTVERLAQFYERNGRIEQAQNTLAELQLEKRDFTIGDLQLIAGDAHSATWYYSSAMRPQSPSEKDAAITLRAEVDARMVEAALQASRPQQAQRLMQATGANFDEATRHILQSEIALQSGDLTGACSEAERAVAIAPASAPAQLQWAIVLERQGRNAESQTAISKAMELDLGYIPAKIELARLLLAQRDAQHAEETIVDVIRDEPANVDALAIYAMSLTALRRFDSAHAITARALAIGKTSSIAHATAGALADAEGREHSALAEYTTALELDPRSQTALDGLSRVYAKGDVTHAMISKMESVAMVAPRSAALLRLTGRLYSDHHDYASAHRALLNAAAIENDRSATGDMQERMPIPAETSVRARQSIASAPR